MQYHHNQICDIVISPLISKNHYCETIFYAARNFENPQYYFCVGFNNKRYIFYIISSSLSLNVWPWQNLGFRPIRVMQWCIRSAMMNLKHLPKIAIFQPVCSILQRSEVSNNGFLICTGFTKIEEYCQMHRVAPEKWQNYREVTNQNLT